MLKLSLSCMIKKIELMKIIKQYGGDILESENMKLQKNFVQHGKFSVYHHSISVAMMSVSVAKKFKAKINMKELVRGALLHDYFLYDWHKKEKWHRFHGYKHAKFAVINASREFELSPVEIDIILKHMFPLNIKIPKYKESVIVCVADKLCAFYETFKIDYFKLLNGEND